MSAVTIFPNVGGTTLQRHDWSADELVEHLRNAGPYLTKHDCPLIKLASFGETRTDKGNLRHDANVNEVHGVEGDYDAGEVSLADAQMMLSENSVEAILYTSASHRREKPRWRVLCPLSRPCPPAERERLVARLNGVLGGILAPESFKLSQSYYVGEVAGTRYEVAQVRGTCIDLLDELDAGAIRPPKNGESRRERIEMIRSNDPVIARLNARGLVLRARIDGGVDIVCPFEDTHTTPRTPGDCTFWPPHTGGFQSAHFHCLHAHCSRRRDYDFFNAIGIASATPNSEAQTAPLPIEWPELDLVALSARVPQPPAHIIPNWLPAGKVTLMGGHGGSGKSALALCLSACVALGVPWCGLPTARRPVLYLSAEDGVDVQHWRLTRICAYLGVKLTSLAQSLRIVDASALDAELMIETRDGVYTTAMYDALAALKGDAKVLVFDGASDLYGASEIERRTVRRYIRALRRLVPADGAALLLAHVDKAIARGRETGDHYSGSTAWNNSVRARWALRSDGDALALKLEKANHARAGAEIRLHWDTLAHMHVADASPVEGGMVGAIKERTQREAIVTAMRACEASRIVVPAATTGPRTAYHVLLAQAAFPESLRADTREARRAFWQRIEQLRASCAIEERLIRAKHRHDVAVLAVAQGASS